MQCKCLLHAIESDALLREDRVENYHSKRNDVHTKGYLAIVGLCNVNVNCMFCKTERLCYVPSGCDLGEGMTVMRVVIKEERWINRDLFSLPFSKAREWRGRMGLL